ncbi:hypothetical protein [Methanoculleus chikugoensis]|uniref:hypothetical protein n=1 Tax=Methanoculleus chikugoensis TaxID=118126 RepID=UPI001FB3421F|nr:hypothetical protein [Methanoculleus chikugoensis]
MEDLVGGLPDRRDQVAVPAVADLERYAADAPGDDGFLLPEPSVTVSPNPSLMDFWTITSDARWIALISRWLSGGRSRIWISGSSSAVSRTSRRTMKHSGSSHARPPTRTSWQGIFRRTILNA